jgi:hypothetical protein
LDTRDRKANGLVDYRNNFGSLIVRMDNVLAKRICGIRVGILLYSPRGTSIVRDHHFRKFDLSHPPDYPCSISLGPPLEKLRLSGGEYWFSHIDSYFLESPCLLGICHDIYHVFCRTARVCYCVGWDVLGKILVYKLPIIEINSQHPG